MLYDISRNLFSVKPYPGDTEPVLRRVQSIRDGAEYALSDVTLCVHNATHMDAPSHFIEGGKTVEKISLESCIGGCEVKSVKKIKKEGIAAVLAERLLLRGELSKNEAAEIAAAKRFVLIGTDAQSIGNAEVHRILLGADIVILEGLNLNNISDGKYELIAFPVKWEGSEGAPVRAVLRTL